MHVICLCSRNRCSILINGYGNILPYNVYTPYCTYTHRITNSQARILFTSTSEIYGDPEVHPQPETYWGHVNPIGPRACYDEGKRVAETMM